jgi:hypothetical protein
MVCQEHWADSNDYTDHTQLQHLLDQLNQRAISILSALLLHPIAINAFLQTHFYYLRRRNFFRQ